MSYIPWLSECHTFHDWVTVYTNDTMLNNWSKWCSVIGHKIVSILCLNNVILWYYSCTQNWLKNVLTVQDQFCFKSTSHVLVKVPKCENCSFYCCQVHTERYYKLGKWHTKFFNDTNTGMLFSMCAFFIICTHIHFSHLYNYSYLFNSNYYYYLLGGWQQKV